MDLNRDGFVIRQFMIVLLTVVLIPFLLFLAWVLMLYIDGYGRVTEKTDISDYCVITGNYDNDRPAEFIHSFFPEEVDDDFSNVSYLYIAQRGDTYACQIWLEFDIENEDAFKDFISSNTVSENVTVLEPGLAVIDCGGVGYGCRVTAYTAGQLKLNQNARLYVTESIREDAFDLYGFISRE